MRHGHTARPDVGFIGPPGLKKHTPNYPFRKLNLLWGNGPNVKINSMDIRAIPCDIRSPSRCVTIVIPIRGERASFVIPPQPGHMLPKNRRRGLVGREHPAHPVVDE
ncbi:hypothetical protein JCM14469_38030 [Desulfatiferula olefinivorans]